MRNILMPFAVLALLTGCKSDKPEHARVQYKTVELDQTYFNSDWPAAHRSLVDEINLVESAAPTLEFQESRAFTLFVDYGRLYAMEHRAGSNDLAELSFIKARYWCLRNSEIHGTDPAGCAAYVEKFASADQLIPFIDKWDRAANNGASPKYLLTLDAQ